MPPPRWRMRDRLPLSRSVLRRVFARARGDFLFAHLLVRRVRPDQGVLRSQLLLLCGLLSGLAGRARGDGGQTARAGAGVRGNLSRRGARHRPRSEEHTSELQSLMRISYAVFCLKKKIPEINIAHLHTISTYHKLSYGT